ncbi:MAG: hypothetical protein J5678_05580 [Bacteroidaceae bacterium]|nr:hypothetical protein [Bacteroidaceae bacterium]
MKTRLILITIMTMVATCGIKAQSDSIAAGISPEMYSEDHPGGWDFSIPFLSSSRSKKNDAQYATSKYILKHNNRAPYPHVTSFNFGFISGADEAQGVNIDMGQSFELEMRNIVAFDNRLSNSSFISLGFGLSWRNYRMTGHNQFLLNDDGLITVAPYPDGANPKFSRIHTFSLVVPLQFHFALGRSWYFSCGPELYFNTYASLKTRYTLNGEKQKFTANHLHRNKVTYGLMCDITHNHIGLYFKYSPCNVLQPDFGPKFKSVTAGLKIAF